MVALLLEQHVWLSQSVFLSVGRLPFPCAMLWQRVTLWAS
jgi:hypothetical protein